MQERDVQWTQKLNVPSLVALFVVLGSAGIGSWQLWRATQIEPRPAPPASAFLWLFVAVAVLLAKRFGTRALGTRAHHEASTVRQYLSEQQLPFDWRLIVAATLNVGAAAYYTQTPAVPPGLLASVWAFGLVLYLSAFVQRPDVWAVRTLGRRPATWLLIAGVLAAIWMRWRGVTPATPGDITLAPMPLLPVVAGGLTLIPLFLLTEDLFDRTAAWAAALMLLGLPLHVHVSRLGANFAFDALVGTIALWALVRATRTDRLLWWAIAGVFLGLGIYLSFAMRAIFLLAVGWLFCTTWLPSNAGGSAGGAPSAQLNGQWSKAGVLLLGGTLALAPLIRGSGEVSQLVWPTGVTMELLGAEWMAGGPAPAGNSLLASLVGKVVMAAQFIFTSFDGQGVFSTDRLLYDLLGRGFILLGVGRLLAAWSERRTLWLAGWLGLTIFVTPETMAWSGLLAPAFAMLAGVGAVWGLRVALTVNPL